MTKLTKLEEYQFSLCDSFALTPASQRAAIKREGLAGLGKQAVLGARRTAYAEWRKQPQNSDLKGLPSWLAAARYSKDGWLRTPPVKAGKIVSLRHLAQLSYASVDWGRARKHDTGGATSHPPRVRTENNGKIGWDCVTNRYADYLCVLSPDGKKVAVQVDSKPISIHAVSNGHFMYRGVRVAISKAKPSVCVHNVRTQFNLLKRAGLDPHIVRQTIGMVSQGSGEDLRDGISPLYCVIPDGIGGYYHVGHFDSVSYIKVAILSRVAKSRQVTRDAELDLILSTSPERVFVSLADSLAAGNCEAGTRALMPKILAAVGANGEVGAVSASVILSIMDDSYTRRACRVAAMRVSR